jgi:hypothetical protein
MKKKEKEIIKIFLLKEIKIIHFSPRIQNTCSWAKMVYFFELIFALEHLLKFRNFGKKSFAEVQEFITNNSLTFEILHKVLINYFKNISNTKIKDIPELVNSKEFLDLIKELRNINFSYEQADKSHREIVYKNPYSKVMVDKVKNLSESLLNKSISFFFLPDKDISLDVKITRKYSIEEYNIPVGNFQKRIKEYFYEKLIQELKKPD